MSEQSNLPMERNNGGGELALPMKDLFADAGSGLEEIDSEALATPYLSIAQKTSAIVDATKPEYNPDVKVGDIYNQLTGERYEMPLLVVPCHFRISYVEKLPGKNGKFVAEHDASTLLATQTKRDNDNHDVLPNGNYLVRTHRHYVLLAETMDPIVITMRSTNMRGSKKWNSILSKRLAEGDDGKQFVLPTFSSQWLLTSDVKSSGDDTWCVFGITQAEDVSNMDLYSAARSFANMVKGGEIREMEDPEA